MAPLADFPFHLDGYPDVTVKALQAALCTLPKFDSNKAYSRLAKYAHQNPLFQPWDIPLESVSYSNFDSEEGSHALEILRQSSAALAISHMSFDPNGLRRCVDEYKAYQYRQDALTQASFLLYADHVSEHLNKTCHLAPLRRLADFPGFPQAFVDALLTQDTVDDMVDQVVAHSGDPTWVEGSLFLMQYFKDPSRPHIVSSSEIWSSPFGQAASKWIQQANMKSEGGRMALIAAKGLPISYGIQENTLFRPPSSQEIFDPLHTMPWASSAVDHSQIFEQIKELGGAQDWQSRAHEIMVLWEGDERGFGETVERLVRETMLYQPDWRRNLCNPDDEVPPGPEALFSFQVQGPEVIDYLRRCESSPFIVCKPGRYWENRAPPLERNGGSASCFIAGTVIATSTGDKPIENLRENDWILTRVGFNEWGLVSDEKVIMPTDSPLIYGFNDEAPFFTAGHVFQTTTGLRAVDPELAMRENPWANVGRLLAGHIVYRLAKDGSRYDQVPIIRIHSHQMPDVNEVYGVHLRDGRRSYHANGYLVMVNYPEITLKRICTTLATFTEGEQLHLLRSIEELNPLFARFGIATISELLQREIAATSDKISARMYNRIENKLAGIGHASVSFEPEEHPLSNYSQLPAALPTVTVFEGVVSVDGVVCEYGSVDGNDNIIRWSRLLSDKNESLIEHGVLKIEDPRYFSALGQISYSTDFQGENPLDLPLFQYLTYGYHCEVEIQKQCVDVSKQQLEFRQLTHDKLIEKPTWVMHSSATAMESSDSAAEASPAEETVDQPDEYKAANMEDQPRVLKTPNAHSRMAAEVTAPVQELKFVVRPRQYDMVFDDRPLQDLQTQIQKQVDFGPVQLTTQRINTDGAPGILFSDIIVPSLDSLLEPLNANLSLTDGNDAKLERLYDTAVTVEPISSQVKATITIPPSTLENIHHAQDQKEAEDPSKVLRFKEKLLSDTSLPILFSRIELLLSPDMTQVVSGTLWEYNLDTSRVGAEGTRHLIISRPNAVSQRVEPRLAQGKVVGAIPTGLDSGPQKHPQFEPPLSVSDLHLQNVQAIFASYSDDAVKARSDSILQNIMYYHMQDDHAAVLTMRDKNTLRLPDYLGANLPSNLSVWIKTTFGPAYTCLQIAESLQTRDWKSTFTDAEKKKILYFWQGQGPKCLARSEEYSTLNRMCLREALLQLHPMLQKFVNDDGKRWAELYFHNLMDVKLDDIIEASANDPRQVDRYCMVLWALDCDGDWPERFRSEVLDSIFGQVVTQRANDDALRDWIPQVVKHFVDAMIEDGCAGVDPKLRDLLRKEFDEFCKVQGIALDKSSKEVMAKQATDILHVNLLASLSGPGFRVIGVGIWRRSFAAMKNQSILDSSLKTRGRYPISAMSLMLSMGAIQVFLNRKNMSDSEIARASADMARSVFDILSPILIRREAKTYVEWAADVALVNQRLRMRLPTSLRAFSRANAREMVFLEHKAAAQEATFLGRLRKKFSISTRVARVLGIALGVVVVAVLIWDLCKSWSRLSGTGKALSTLLIVLESAALICTLIGVFTACTIIPIIGQVIMVFAIVVGILLYFFGQPEREKTPGEKFVDSMKASDSWVSKLDDPPAPLLDYTITPTEVPKNADYALQITAKNNTGQDLDVIAEPGKESLSNTELVSVKFGFTSGSDGICLFSNKSFSDSSHVADGVGKCSFSGPSVFKASLITPNGTSDTFTGYDYRMVGFASKATLAKGASFTVTVAGKGGSGDRDFTLKVCEERPDIPCALRVQTLSRKK